MKRSPAKPPKLGDLTYVLAWHDPATKEWSLLAFASLPAARSEVPHLPDPSRFFIYTCRIENAYAPKAVAS